MSATLSDQQHDWASQFCGLDTRSDDDSTTDTAAAAPPTDDAAAAPPTDDAAAAPPTDDATAAPPTDDATAAPPTDDAAAAPPTDTVAAAPPTDDAAAAPPTDDAAAAPPTDTVAAAPPTGAASADDSDAFKMGYQDGLSGGDPNPPPLAPAGMDEYQDGYAKGHYEFSQKSSSSSPTGPNSSEGPAVTPAPPTETGPNQSVETPEGQAAYQMGFQDALTGAPSNPIGRAGFQYAQDYTSGYNDGQIAAKKAEQPPSPPYDGPSVGPLSDEEFERGKEAMKAEEEREERIREFMNEREDPHTHNEGEPGEPPEANPPTLVVPPVAD